MADNVQLNAGSGGAVAATDDISGVHFQRMKMAMGADGVYDGDVSETNPMPVINGFQEKTGSISAVNSNLYSGSPSANSTVQFDNPLHGVNTVLFRFGGTFSVTGMLAQVSLDGTQWFTLRSSFGFAISNENNTLSPGDPGSMTAKNLYRFEIFGAKYFRITCSGYTSGTVEVTMIATNSDPFRLRTALPINLTELNGSAFPSNVGDASVSVRTVNASKSSATLANVASSATNVTLLASSSSRSGAIFFNDSTQTLYLKFGATASTSSFTVKIGPGGTYELTGPNVYSGVIDGIWDVANGNCRVTSW